MQIEDTLMRNEEKVIFKLRNLYQRYGYQCFKMSKFEEYDLYSQNKDFLASDGIITFNDANGKLMALKPDVTLSIVKNFKPASGCVERIYYNSNVYRSLNKNDGYKEIMQMGLECLGDITEYNLYEVVCLAAASLQTISRDSVLNISHLGILAAILDGIDIGTERSNLLECIDEKNAHGVESIGKELEICEENVKLLKVLAETYGEPAKVISVMEGLTDREDILTPLRQLEKIANYAKRMSNVDIRIDLSLTGELNYYNGIIFRGFVKGVPAGILSGGQYDYLMEKMGKKAKAIGFAVYLDLLEGMEKPAEYDGDVLLIYSKEDDPSKVIERVLQLNAQGYTVSAQTEVPERQAYKRIEKLTEV